MKTYNITAVSLKIWFTNEDGNLVEGEVTDLPQPNLQAKNAEKSRNSDEKTIDYDEEHSYKVVLEVNMYEGNVQIFNDETDEEIENFDIEEIGNEGDLSDEA